MRALSGEGRALLYFAFRANGRMGEWANGRMGEWAARADLRAAPAWHRHDPLRRQGRRPQRRGARGPAQATAPSPTCKSSSPNAARSPCAGLARNSARTVNLKQGRKKGGCCWLDGLRHPMGANQILIRSVFFGRGLARDAKESPGHAAARWGWLSHIFEPQVPPPGF